MTTIVTEYESRGRFGSSLRLLASAVAACHANLRRRWQAQAQAAFLRSLDDRTLADIGIIPDRRNEPSLFNAPGRAIGTALRAVAACAPPR